MFRVLALFASLLLITSCGIFKRNKRPIPLAVEKIVIETNPKITILDTTGYEITKIVLSGDILYLWVRHAGYEYDLIADNRLSPTNPPQLNIFLKRQKLINNNKVQENIMVFDLSSLRTISKQTMLLNLNGTAQNINY